MTKPETNGVQKVPSSALLLSLLALLVPVVSELTLPHHLLGANQGLLWLIALIPAFLLAYHRGWKGAATALAGGMAALSVTQAASVWMDHPLPDVLVGVVVAFIALALGIGWLAELLHRDRAKVEDLALTDLLTRLPNRRHAMAFLENEFAAAQRGLPLSAVLFDLDSFKLYNDRFGHQAGDEALEAFAGILSSTTRRMNLSARFGGEEFLSVLAGSDAEGALIFAERVRATLRALTLPRGSLTVSAGVAEYHSGMRNPDELLAAADGALYQAKREGRNRVRLSGRSPESGAGADVQGVKIPGTEDDGATQPWPSVEEEAPGAPVTLPPHPVTGFGQKRRLLLVEDDEAVRGLLESYLRKEGFQLTSVGAVGAGLRELSTEFDCVLTDLKLPGGWGMELVTATKVRWPATQVLVLTGVRDPQVTAEAHRSGADRVLPKPFGLEELGKEIQDALSRRDWGLLQGDRKRAVAIEEKERRGKAEELIVGGLQSLIDATEIRAPHTLGRHRTVSAFTSLILGGMDPEGPPLPPADSLSLGGKLLDLGIIAVPDTILNKPGSLLPEEMEILREHTMTGRRILQPLLDDETVLEVVTWHHERWDGTGYPNGLNGEAIPLSARIAAVADAMDALIHSRPHREALPWDDAVQTILEEDGHFDPGVLAAFETVLPELKKRWRGELAAPPPPRVPADVPWPEKKEPGAK